MRILIDECLPIQARHFFPGHDARTVQYMEWKMLKNGFLLAAAERAGFAVLVTSDGNMYKEHDLTGRDLAVVVVPTNKLKELAAMASLVRDAVENARPGEYHTLPRPGSESLGASVRMG